MCVYEAIYIGPHRLLANSQGGSPSSLPPPARSGGGNRPLGSAAGPELSSPFFSKHTMRVALYLAHWPPHVGLPWLLLT